MTLPAGVGDVVAAARGDASRAAASGRLTDETLGSIRRAGLFKLFVPRSLGGFDLPLPEACEVVAAVAEGDGAAGWAVMIGAGPAWFAGWMPPGLAAAVFGAEEAAVAGSGQPGAAEPAEGGWRVSGRWPWCSGAPWATWFTFNAVTDGDPDRLFTFAVPAGEVAVDPGSWDVRALEATASLTASLDAVFVPHAHTFRVGNGSPPQPAPTVSRVPFMAFAQATMAAVSVGLSRRLLAEFAALARGKVPFGRDVPMNADPAVADRFARAAASTRAAAAGLDRAVGTLWERVAGGQEPSGADELDVHLAACEAVRAGADAAGQLWTVAGMDVLARSSDLGRAAADLKAVSQNGVVSSGRFADAGAALLR